MAIDNGDAAREERQRIEELAALAELVRAAFGSNREPQALENFDVSDLELAAMDRAFQTRQRQEDVPPPLPLPPTTDASKLEESRVPSPGRAFRRLPAAALASVEPLDTVATQRDLTQAPDPYRDSSYVAHGPWQIHGPEVTYETLEERSVVSTAQNRYTLPRVDPRQEHDFSVLHDQATRQKVLVRRASFGTLVALALLTVLMHTESSRLQLTRADVAGANIEPRDVSDQLRRADSQRAQGRLDEELSTLEEARVRVKHLATSKPINASAERLLLETYTRLISVYATAGYKDDAQRLYNDAESLLKQVDRREPRAGSGTRIALQRALETPCESAQPTADALALAWVDYYGGELSSRVGSGYCQIANRLSQKLGRKVSTTRIQGYDLAAVEAMFRAPETELTHIDIAILPPALFASATTHYPGLMTPIATFEVPQGGQAQRSYLFSREHLDGKQLCKDLKRGKKKLALVDELSTSGGIWPRIYFYNLCRLDVFKSDSVTFLHDHGSVISAVASSSADAGAVWSGMYDALPARHGYTNQQIILGPIPVDAFVVRSSMSEGEIKSIETVLLSPESAHGFDRSFIEEHFPGHVGIVKPDIVLYENLKTILASGPFSVKR